MNIKKQENYYSYTIEILIIDHKSCIKLNCIYYNLNLPLLLSMKTQLFCCPNQINVFLVLLNDELSW